MQEDGIFSYVVVLYVCIIISMTILRLENEFIESTFWKYFWLMYILQIVLEILILLRYVEMEFISLPLVELVVLMQGAVATLV